MSEIKTFKLEKHQTKDIVDKHVNGFMIPIWRDWDKFVTIKPAMVYVTAINPGEIKGPHLHIVRHSYFVCVKGKVVFVIKDESGKYSEIETSEDNPVLIEIPKERSSAHINPTSEQSLVLAIVDPSWKPDNKDEHNVTYDDYDWKKWNLESFKH